MNTRSSPSAGQPNSPLLPTSQQQIAKKRNKFGMLARIFMALAVVAGTLLGGQVAAQAHDSLEATLPADRSTVEAMPAMVTTTMSNTPAAIGAEIQVLDAVGTNWSQGGVSVLDNVASQPVRGGAPAGKYTVKWRLVSSDSHPIEGQFSFTTKFAAAGSAGAVGGAVAGPAQSLSVVSEQAAPTTPDSGAVPWSIYWFIAVLVAVVIAMIVLTRRRMKMADAGTRGSEHLK